MTVEADLIGYLLADSGVAAIVGTRITPVSRTQGDPLPALTVTRVSGAPLYADEGEVGLTNARIQVDSWGSTYTSAKDLAAAVLTRLSAVQDVLQGSTTFIYITMDNEQDFREGGAGEPEYLFRVSQDFIVWTGG